MTPRNLFLSFCLTVTKVFTLNFLRPFIFLAFAFISMAQEDKFDGLSELPNRQTPSKNPALILEPLEDCPFIRLRPGCFYAGSHPDTASASNPIDLPPVRIVSWSPQGGRTNLSQPWRRTARQKVCIRGEVELGKHEVTQAQWTNVMGINPSRFIGETRPVESISFYDALLFVEKLNHLTRKYHYRLPSAEEWEYAYRAGEEGHFFWTNLYRQSDQVKKDPVLGFAVYGWFEENTSDPEILYRQGGIHLSEHQPVGIKPPNAWGFCDVAGNVAEFTASAFSLPDGVNWVNAYDSLTDSNQEGIVVMGGSYANNAACSRDLRSSQAANPGARIRFSRSSKASWVGLRLLREIVLIDPPITLFLKDTRRR